MVPEITEHLYMGNNYVLLLSSVNLQEFFLFDHSSQVKKNI